MDKGKGKRRRRPRRSATVVSSQQQQQQQREEEGPDEDDRAIIHRLAKGWNNNDVTSSSIDNGTGDDSCSGSSDHDDESTIKLLPTTTPNSFLRRDGSVDFTRLFLHHFTWKSTSTSTLVPSSSKTFETAAAVLLLPTTTEEKNVDDDTKKEEVKYQRPLHIELGSGSGEWIAGTAASDPDSDYVAVELRADRVARAFANLVLWDGLGLVGPLTNVCVVGAECGSFLRQRVTLGTVSTIFVNHPEPPTQTFGFSGDGVVRIAAATGVVEGNGNGGGEGQGGGGVEEPAHVSF